jgi:hypothetical protein
MNEQRFLALVRELIDENPFAIRAVLKILDIVFTISVPTLAVTIEERPRLLVNLDFVGAHCHNDAQAKAVLCHEFLHVLLCHTEGLTRLTRAKHIALDAVINAIIHRQYGPAYSSMMSRYYEGETGLAKLLRPMNVGEEEWFMEHAFTPRGVPAWASAWNALYEGRLVADDIEALAGQILESGRGQRGGDPGPFVLEREHDRGNGDLLGNHDDLGRVRSKAFQDAIEEAMREMNGSGIWRNPRGRGIGANPFEVLHPSGSAPKERWRRTVLEILKRHLRPDAKSRINASEAVDYRIPVLSPRDRQAFMKSLWLPYLPDALWSAEKPVRAGTAQVYLDVSGSMGPEMPEIVSLLGSLSRFVRRPFWAFSDEVAPAVIEAGRLRTLTSGGTSMACVLEHVAKTRPASAVVVTDGFIEAVDKPLVRLASGTRLHAIVTRDGKCAELARAGIPYTQLEKLPR